MFPRKVDNDKVFSTDDIYFSTLKTMDDHRAVFISPVHHSSAQGEANLSANLLRWKSMVRAGGTGGNTVPVLLLAHACFAFEF